MSYRSLTAGILAALVLSSALAGLAGASTETTYDGDVIVNGAFTDMTPMGHPLKANDPSQSGFVAYDWLGGGATFESAAPGLWMNKTEGTEAFLHQYFNGTFATARAMRFYGAEFTLSAPAGGVTAELYLRYRDATGSKQVIKPVVVGNAPQTFRILPQDVAATTPGFIAGNELDLVSVKLVLYQNEALLVHKVSVLATNGVDGRNIHITTAGDDAVTALGNAALVSPGADGKYSFLVGLAADSGDFLPTAAAYACLYNATQAVQDMGYPANNASTGMCRDAYLKHDSAAITTTRVGDAFRVDIDASAVRPPVEETNYPAFALYATIKFAGPSGASDWKSGYFHLGRVAADQANRNVSSEFYGPTPIFVDRDANGKPDYAQTQDVDGYAVILEPQYATTTPALAVMTPNAEGFYVFKAQVYQYENGVGAPIDPVGGFSMGIFNADNMLGGSYDGQDTLWYGDADDMTFDLPNKALYVRVPMEALGGNTVVGAWGFYNLGEPQTTNAFGSSTGTTDFFSTPRNAVKEFAVADAMRTLATPIVLDHGSITRDATVVVRMDGDADTITPLDGTLVVDDGGDGTVAFEYALVLPEGRTLTPTGGHALAIYDAAGVVSDDLQPGSRALKHAETVMVGQQQPDGWFRVEVPTSAFTEAKGAVGAWAYADTQMSDGYLLSRSGWYNVLKAPTAAVSTSAAEAALYPPTPIVVADAELGIPMTLASAIKGAGTGLLSVTNPVVNPGFEAAMLVEQGFDNRDAASGYMTSPPWFFRTDDQAGGQTGQSVKPNSVHEVVAGQGRSGDSAMRVKYHVSDNGRGVMLGQLLGNENGENALLWQGATSVALDVNPGTAPATIGAMLRWAGPDGVVKQASQKKTVAPGWSRIELATPVPADGVVYGLYLTMSTNTNQFLLFDNVAIKGSKPTIGDARSDLMDGYATIIEPMGLSGLTQSTLQGVDGAYYVYNVSFVDYTNGAPRALDLAGRASAFALRTQDFQASTGSILALRDSSEHFAAVVPAGGVPAQAAAPWAWTEAGSVYQTLGFPEDQQPASGYFSLAKNALRGMPLADQLDYAATPVQFGAQSAGSLVAPQTLRITQLTSGDWGVVAGSDTLFVETTTITVKDANGAVLGTYPATLSSKDGTLVPGLVLADDVVSTVTVTSAPTAFTTGGLIAQGTPAPEFDACRASETACTLGAVQTGETIVFKSRSSAPNGESLTTTWNFGDGQTATGAEVTHFYSTPGEKTVTMTVTTPSGRSASLAKTIVINNRAPHLPALSLQPSVVFVDSNVVVSAAGVDSDGGSLTYAWRVNGNPVAGVTGSSLRLTPAVLLAATDVAGLVKGQAYTVNATVSDGQLTGSRQVSFTVGDRPSSLTTPVVEVVGFPNATYALEGETVRATVNATDADDAAVDAVSLSVSGLPALVAMARGADGNWTATFTAPAAQTMAIHAVATTASGATNGPAMSFESRENALPEVLLVGPNLTQAFQATTFNATAVDPDGRGPVTFAWTVNGTAVAGADGLAYTWDMTDDDRRIGESVVQVVATDANGGQSTAALAVTVDDALQVELGFVHKAENLTDGHIMRVRVLDVYGNPVRNAQVRIEDFFEPLPFAVSTQNLRTNAQGESTFRVAPEAAVIGLPLTHRVVATVTAGSVAAAPVQDAEVGVDSIVFENDTPFAGVPLP